MTLSTKKVIAEYDRISPLFSLGDMIAFPHRQKLIANHVLRRVNLSAGQTVVDLCCGAGHNLPMLVDAVGPTGQIIGIDLSDKLLARAQQRVTKCGWSNVTLLKLDACKLSEYVEHADVVLVSLALSLMPDKALVLNEIKKTLRQGGYLVVIEFRPFRGFARILNPILYSLMLPMPNINQAIFKEADASLAHIMQVFPNYEYTEHYCGGNYVAIALKE